MSFPNLQNKTVLVVEDDDMSFLYLNQLFMLTKVQIDSCHDQDQRHWKNSAAEQS